MVGGGGGFAFSSVKLSKGNQCYVWWESEMNGAHARVGAFAVRAGSAVSLSAKGE